MSFIECIGKAHGKNSRSDGQFSLSEGGQHFSGAGGGIFSNGRKVRGLANVEELSEEERSGCCLNPLSG